MVSLIEEATVETANKFQMAALQVLRQVGKVADTDFLAMETLPILWTFALGPLLDLKQFQAFVSLIKSFSSHIEREQTRKLQELTSSNGAPTSRATVKQNTWSAASPSTAQVGGEADFESLVTGHKAKNGTPDILSGWDASSTRPNTSQSSLPPQSNPGATKFAWSGAAPSQPASRQLNILRATPANTRSVTPDQSLNSTFSALTPNTPYSQPLQPMTATTTTSIRKIPTPSYQSTMTPAAPAINWSSAANNSSANWGASQRPGMGSMAGPPMAATQRMPSFSIPPPPTSPLSAQQNSGFSSFSSTLQPTNGTGSRAQPSPAAAPAKKGLDMYESLL